MSVFWFGEGVCNMLEVVVWFDTRCLRGRLIEVASRVNARRVFLKWVSCVNLW